MKQKQIFRQAECPRVAARIECEQCGYPYSEARYFLTASGNACDPLASESDPLHCIADPGHVAALNRPDVVREPVNAVHYHGYSRRLTGDKRARIYDALILWLIVVPLLTIYLVGKFYLGWFS